LFHKKTTKRQQRQQKRQQKTKRISAPRSFLIYDPKPIDKLIGAIPYIKHSTHSRASKVTVYAYQHNALGIFCGDFSYRFAIIAIQRLIT
jgi:uncharacterized protein YegL